MEGKFFPPLFNNMNLNSIFTKIRKKKVFNYSISNIDYECYVVKDYENKINRVAPYYAVLEVKNIKNRDPKALYNPLYGIHESKATWADIRKMTSYFQGWLLRDRPEYIEISPYIDSPAKRMKVFDRMLTDVGYNIVKIEFAEYTICNAKGRIYTPATFYYSQNEREFISRDEYEKWLEETIPLER